VCEGEDEGEYECWLGVYVGATVSESSCVYVYVCVSVSVSASYREGNYQ
jgi:hypothetical protein